MCFGDDLAQGSVLRPDQLHQGSSGGFGILCFGLVVVCFCLSVLGIVAGFLFLGFGVSGSVRFPGVSLSGLCSVFRFLAFLLLALLHLAYFSLRLGHCQEHLPELPAAMDPFPIDPGRFASAWVYWGGSFCVVYNHNLG